MLLEIIHKGMYVIGSAFLLFGVLCDVLNLIAQFEQMIRLEHKVSGNYAVFIFYAIGLILTRNAVVFYLFAFAVVIEIILPVFTGYVIYYRKRKDMNKPKDHIL